MSQKLSVVIPAYNCENTIELCLNSILSQTYRNLEIIVVDDGSVDKTFEICKRLSEKDNRIHIFHKENGGQASARNYGLDRCTGEYITFVDDDDYLDNIMYETLLFNMEKNKVMISGCATKCEDVNGKLVTTTHYGNSGLKSGLDVILNILYRTKSCWGTVWNKIFDSKLKDFLYFPKGCELEDYYVILRIMFYQKNVYYHEIPFYHWVQRKNSQSNRPFYENRLTELMIIDEVTGFFAKHDNSQKIIRACKHFKAISVSTIIILMWKTGEVELKNRIRSEMTMLLFEVIGYSVSFRHFKMQSFKDLVHALLIVSICGIKRG